MVKTLQLTAQPTISPEQKKQAEKAAFANYGALEKLGFKDFGDAILIHMKLKRLI